MVARNRPLESRVPVDAKESRKIGAEDVAILPERQKAEHDARHGEDQSKSVSQVEVFG